ncbi:AAA domain-containing protein [Achromobacter pestifer]|uniref:AAA domain-containing protein n=1 Tax=Achromobacter pestifer TaxID=1353889 RepID=UPI0020B800C6|nr:AAA domain-containing protein [Achromobacter pestifer]
MPRWQFRNLADNHQIIGVTCNQIDHLLDVDSEDFDLVIVDECSKATLPEWIMAMCVARKCILVGDHKQLPPTFCEEENDALDTVDAFQGRQADIVFFSFVRTTGPATFYGDSRRMNVAISRARDAVYLVGDLKYIKSKNIEVLKKLAKLGVVEAD